MVKTDLEGVVRTQQQSVQVRGELICVGGTDGNDFNIPKNHCTSERRVGVGNSRMVCTRVSSGRIPAGETWCAKKVSSFTPKTHFVLLRTNSLFASFSSTVRGCCSCVAGESLNTDMSSR